MYLSILVLLGGLSIAVAFPGIDSNNLPRQVQVPPINLPLSADEGNSGPIPNLAFNAADQFVDVRPGTAHQFIAPGKGDKRGPCPGLNAAANHGFISHSGITTPAEAAAGLNAAFGMGVDTGTLLSLLAVALSGDPLTQVWSIGGSYDVGLLGGLLSSPGGLSNSHNKFESDASGSRYDAYLNGGNGNALEMLRFDKLYFSAESYTLDILRDHATWSRNYSIEHNPFFFAGVFAGSVPSVAHHFIAVLMSNHSSSEPQGYIDRNILKTFFSVSGPDEQHVWDYGQEKIPQNWYKRPSLNPYDLASVVADVEIFIVKDPNILQTGGNTGTVNSFVGLNPGDLTEGVINAQNLLQGNNLACYLFQATRLAVPQSLLSALSLLDTFLSPLLLSLSCPQLHWDQTALSQFPGYGYQPSVVPKV